MTLSQKTEDWEKIERMAQMVRQSNGERRKQILNEIFVPAINEYRIKYGETYNPLKRPCKT